MNLDTAILNYRHKAEINAKKRVAFEKASKEFLLSQRELMFAKDDMRAAELGERDVENVQPIPANAVII